MFHSRSTVRDGIVMADDFDSGTRLRRRSVGNSTVLLSCIAGARGLREALKVLPRQGRRANATVMFPPHGAHRPDPGSPGAGNWPAAGREVATHPSRSFHDPMRGYAACVTD